jgi:hypothetical protein
VKVGPKSGLAGPPAGNPRIIFVGAASNGSADNQGASGKTGSSRRVTVMCFVLASVFSVTSMPIVIDVLIISRSGNRGVPVNIYPMLTTTRTFNACIDPVIYGVMWRPFRKALVQVCTVCHCLVQFLGKSYPTGRLIWLNSRRWLVYYLITAMFAVTARAKLRFALFENSKIKRRVYAEQFCDATHFTKLK